MASNHPGGQKGMKHHKSCQVGLCVITRLSADTYRRTLVQQTFDLKNRAHSCTAYCKPFCNG